MSVSTSSKNTLPASTRFLFGFLLVLCVTMIGATGYVKMRLDQVETTLSAPDQAFSPDQEVYERTVLALGYSGFLGSAQNFMNKQERRSLDDMRMNYKTAEEFAGRAADKGTGATRRDVKAILELFSSILAKAEAGGDALGSGITPSDLVLASNGLSLLDARLQTAIASNRVEAQNSYRIWGFCLTLLAVAGFLLAGLLAIRTNMAQRRNLSHPLQALRLSVSNMVRGDLQNPIWGMERNDEVGQLARAMDNARLYFAQLPDVSVIDENGALRVKFEGETRSAFRSLTQKMAEQFERSTNAITGFSGTLDEQQKSIASLTNKLNLLFNQIQQSCAVNDDTIQNLSKSLSNASVSLAASQQTGVQQIAKLIPAMQERMKNMAEVTQLAGTQISQSLQSMIKAEHTMRGSATQGQQTVQQLANATNQMGERMFAALNLLQASGKLLNETTEGVKTRMGEALDTLGRSEGKINQMIQRTEDRLANTVDAEENMARIASRTQASAEKMEKAVSTIYERHEMLGEQVVTASHRMDSIVASFDTAQRTMSDAVGQIRRDGSLVANLLQELRSNNEQLLTALSHNSQSGFTAVQSLAEKSHALMQRLEVQIQAQAKAAESRIDELSSHSQTMAQQASSTTSSLAQTIAALKGEQERLAASRSRFSETLDDLSTRLEQHATSTFGKTEQWAAQSFVKLTGIAEQMESVMQRLNMLGQLTGTLGTVAGQLGQIVPTLTQYGQSLPAQSSLQPMADQPPVIIDMESTKTLIVQQTEDVITQLHDQWHKAVLQIEAMHDQLAQLVIQQKEQLETRLVVMDKKIREATSAFETASEVADTDERQAEIMNELISAMSKINEHVLELDDVIEEAGLKKPA